MAVAEIPVIKRQEKIKEPGIPQFQSAFESLGESGNIAGVIGAQIAQSASNTMAKQLGTASGTHPHGDLYPSITEFDKNFAASYEEQAKATLGNQAEKLVTDIQIQLAKEPRLSTSIIQNANEQLRLGLANISQNAPTSIKTNLDASFASTQLSLNKTYTEKMIGQQREDQKNNLENANGNLTKSTFEKAKNGDLKGATIDEKNAHSMANNALNNRFITPAEATERKDAATQARINGQYVYGAEQSYRNGTFAKYSKDFADDKLPDMDKLTSVQKYGAGAAMSKQIEFLEKLKKEQQNIEAVKFEEEILTHPENITPARMIQLKEQVTPLQWEKLNFELIKVNKKLERQDAGIKRLDGEGFSNPVIHSSSKPEAIDGQFEKRVIDYVQDGAKSGKTISLEEAQTQVATRSAGPIPALTKQINEQLASTDPKNIEAAGRMMDQLNRRNKSAVLKDVNKEAIGMYNSYLALRRTVPPQQAAEKAYDMHYRVPKDEKELNDRYEKTINSIKDSEGKLSFFSNLGGFEYAVHGSFGHPFEQKYSNLVDPIGYVDQAEAIFHNEFNESHGDINTAKKRTADILKNTWGPSKVNGREQITFYPIEQAAGLPEDGTRTIQDDIIKNVNKELEKTKIAFDKGSLPYYLEIEPRKSVDQLLAEETTKKEHPSELATLHEPPIYGHELIDTAIRDRHVRKIQEGEEIKIHKHWKNGVRETFPLYVKADPWLAKTANPTVPYAGGWDIVLGTENGYIALNRLAPMLDKTIVYNPDVEKLKRIYSMNHSKMQKFIWGK